MAQAEVNGMTEPYSVHCATRKCGFVFVFGEQPPAGTEAICPICSKAKMISEENDPWPTNKQDSLN